MTTTWFDLTAGEEVTWPDGPEAARVRGWLEPFAGRPSHHAVSNVHAQVGVVVVDDVTLPFTVHEGAVHEGAVREGSGRVGSTGEASTGGASTGVGTRGAGTGGGDRGDESHVASPLAHYVGAARAELASVDPPVRGARWIDGALGGLRWTLRRAGFDRAVYLNNRPVSTNLYPHLRRDAIVAVHHAALERYPTHALVWRSLDRTCNEEVMSVLEALGYRSIFARRIWYQDPSSASVRGKKSFRRDGSIWRRSGYRVVDARDLPVGAFERVRDLYELLYVDKHASANPRPTTETWRAWHEGGALHVRALVRDDAVDAVFGYWHARGVVTAPLFGYDTRLPEAVGLYRIASRAYADEARDRGWLVHASAGVGRFKRHRGAVPTNETTMAYVRHLPAVTRAAWRTVEAVANGPGRRMVERIES